MHILIDSRRQILERLKEIRQSVKKKSKRIDNLPVACLSVDDRQIKIRPLSDVRPFNVNSQFWTNTTRNANAAF